MNGRVLLYLAWVVALVGLIGSLYLGEISGVQPCTYCWYQRVALYPLALLLGIACYRDDRGIVVYALPLALMGAVIALLQTLQVCTSTCRPTLLSTLSLLGFCSIAALLFLVRKASIK